MIHGDEFRTRRVTAHLRDGELFASSAFPQELESNPGRSGPGMLSGFGLGLCLRYGFAPSPFSLWDRVFVANRGEALKVANGRIQTGFELSGIRPRTGGEVASCIRWDLPEVQVLPAGFEHAEDPTSQLSTSGP